VPASNVSSWFVVKIKGTWIAGPDETGTWILQEKQVFSVNFNFYYLLMFLNNYLKTLIRIYTYFFLKLGRELFKPLYFFYLGSSYFNLFYM
jgi:hypothetical protein